MGMKVAAVSTLCADYRIFDSMWMAGTYCPYMGAIGIEAKEGWEHEKGEEGRTSFPVAAASPARCRPPILPVRT